MKPLCIDLFCGYGGWARGFLDAGYRVIGFDNEPKCAKRYPGEFVLADVRNMDGRRFANARVIVASPPCQKFSTLWTGTPQQGPDGRFVPGPSRPRGKREEGMPLVREAFRIIDEANPDFWAIENVAGSRRYISLEFGNPRAYHFPQVLWGRFPGFIAPKISKGFHLHGHKERSHDHRTNALIPYPLARALAEACLPETLVAEERMETNSFTEPSATESSIDAQSR